MKVANSRWRDRRGGELFYVIDEIEDAAKIFSQPIVFQTLTQTPSPL